MLLLTRLMLLCLFCGAVQANAFNFAGTIGLDSCSGSLVIVKGRRVDQPAWVLTNGHCIGREPRPGEAIKNVPSQRGFAILDSQARTIGRMRATRLIYATMTQTDLAIYETSLTYQQIFDQFQIQPLELAEAPAPIGQALEVISSYWRRGYACRIDFVAHQLLEGGYWMSESIRFSEPGCETIGGTSGSPIVAAGTRTMIGINNTGNEDGEECTMNNPCEVDEAGRKSYRRGWSYGQQTYWIYSCLTENGDFDSTISSCQLPH
jgi:V8-like Glu-specific endopeptidase